MNIAEHHHHNHHHLNHHEPMSPTSAAELAIANRKFAKTCVEKKRRDRINKCLDELKEIMSQTDDKARYQKMEKAEILEMAVNYMRMSMSGGGKFSQTPSNDVYSLAYNQLLADFTHSLATMPGLRDDFKAQILNQMGAQILRNKMAAAMQKPPQTTSPSVTAQVPPPPPPPPTSSSQPSQKRRRLGGSDSTNANKKYCVDTTPLGSAQQYFMYSGSCSSLDTNVHVPVSPCGSTSSSSCSVGGGSGCDAQALNLSSSSTHSSNSSSSSSSSSSPPVSACSSPNSSSSIKSSSCPTSNSSSSSSTSTSDCFNKIFRPYL